jgi:hypothetical protein
MDQTLTLQNVASKLVQWQDGKIVGPEVVGTAEFNSQSFIFKNLNSEVVLQVAIPEIHHITTFPADNGGINFGLTLQDSREYMLEALESDSGLPESTQIHGICKELGITLDDYASSVSGGPSPLDLSLKNILHMPKYFLVLTALTVITIVVVAVIRLS